MTWWNNDWDYRLRVKVNSDYVDSNLTDVPLWVRLRDGNFDFTRTTTSGGEEIRFVDYNNIQIPHEITQWNTASGIGDIWVKFSEVSSTEDSYVWMYYGNSTASGVPPVEVSSNVENDEFPGTTLSGIWAWDAGTGGSYTVSGSNLRISSGSGDIWAASYDPTWVYQSAGTGDFDVSTKLYSADITANYRQAGILVVVDSSNFWKLVKVNNGGELVSFGNTIGAAAGPAYTTDISYTADTIYLRVKRVDDAVYGYYKANEEDDWILITHPSNKLYSSSAVTIGLVAVHPSSSQFTADFDWFRKTHVDYSTTVWDDYELVYHLNDETLDGTAGQVQDSSPVSNNGTSTGHPTPGYTGVVSTCPLFDGSDYITSVGAANAVGADDRTTMLWFKPTVADQGQWAGMFTYGASSTNAGWFMESATNNEDYYAFLLYGLSADTPTWIAVDPSEGWNHWALSWDGTDWKGFYNGNIITNRSASPNTTASVYLVGRNWDIPTNCIGYLDEVRVSTEAIDDDEIKVQYLNIAEHSKIMSYDEPDYEGLYPQWLGDYGQRIKLTIDHTKVDEPLEDFPTLVKVSDSSGVNSTNLRAFFNELTLSSGTYNVMDYWDDFTSASGSAPNSDKWVETDTLNVMSIQNNKLYFDGGGSDYKEAKVVSRFRLDGNYAFDVQIDWDILTWTPPSGGPDHYAGHMEIAGGSQYTRSYRQRSSTVNRMRLFGDGGTNDFAWNLTATTGKTRFTWDGTSVLKAYVWTGSQWEWNGNTSGYTCSENYAGDEVTITLYFKQEPAGHVEATSDNFTINSGHVIYDVNQKKTAFTTWNGTQQCYAEIEEFNVTDERALFWVNVPYISDVDDTVLYLYYDSSQSNNTDYVGDVGSFAATKVWDDDFQIVCHMANTPTGSANDIKNSAKGWHGTSYNMASSTLGTSSYGRYLSFDGTADFIDFGDVFYTNELTVETIANVTSFTGGQPRIMINKRNSVGTATENDTEWSFHFTNATNLGFSGWSNINVPVACGYGSAPNFQGTEYYVAGTTGPLIGDVIELYINDTNPTSCTRTVDDIENTSSAWQIGSRSNNNSSRYFHGNIREVRISTIIRPAAWTKATYYTSWDDLISYSAPENDEVFRFQGTVEVLGVPSSRTVYLYRRDTGELVRETTSNEIDGLFEAGSPHWDYHFFVILPELDETYDLIGHDKIHPGN